MGVETPGFTAEPPFPLCPCWACCGNFDFFYYTGICKEVLLPSALSLFTALIDHPLSVLRSAAGGPTAQVVRMIRRYQTAVSAHTPPRCPFTPSCSNYAIVALERFGLWRGVRLAIARLYRCRADVAWGTPNPVPIYGSGSPARRRQPDLYSPRVPTTAVPRRRGFAVAACLLLLPALSGCYDQERPLAEPLGNSPATTVPRPGTKGTVTGTLAPTPTRAIVVASPTSAVLPQTATLRAPVVRSLAANPDRVDPRACTPPDPPERPEVVVLVDAPGLDLAATVVTLSYEVFGTDYQGEVRMRYDPARKLFVHRLPPVTAAAVGETANGVSLSVQAAHPSVRPTWVPPPTPGWIPIGGRCIVVENGAR